MVSVLNNNLGGNKLFCSMESRNLFSTSLGSGFLLRKKKNVDFLLVYKRGRGEDNFKKRNKRVGYRRRRYRELKWLQRLKRIYVLREYGKEVQIAYLSLLFDRVDLELQGKKFFSPRRDFLSLLNYGFISREIVLEEDLWYILVSKDLKGRLGASSVYVLYLLIILNNV